MKTVLSALIGLVCRIGFFERAGLRERVQELITALRAISQSASALRRQYRASGLNLSRICCWRPIAANPRAGDSVRICAFGSDLSHIAVNHMGAHSFGSIAHG
jgi:hypothetical protein